MKKFLTLLIVLAYFCSPAPVLAQSSDDATPPSQPVKLIFIHHSTGENWLRDGYGNLGRTLSENNYFVSDTNYGWGPDAIGDRTDIPNWTEWFASGQTPVYFQALLNENQQHADYTRTFGDPGGENTIIMFKSCFPNSDLEGAPDDPPDPEGWLSVGHAKYVYNQILPFFGAHPDKLFVVITAPPLSDSTHAANARAFNNWLLNDWLRENNYGLNNVAVFDFYNILTSPDAHHRYTNGQIEHTVTSRNTLAYPSGDDHPSEAGSQKATQEFLPMLNIFYNRWRSSASQAPQQPAGQPGHETLTAVGEIDGFEAANPLSGAGWQAYTDETADTRMACAPAGTDAHGGARAMQIDFSVQPGSWGTCDLRFDQVQDWTSADGISFFVRTPPSGLPFDVDLFAGTPEQVRQYVYKVESLPSSENWTQVTVAWGDFTRVSWEENAGAPLDSPASIVGLAFGFAPGDAAQSGQMWIDDLQLSGGQPAVEPPAQAAPVATEAVSSPASPPEPAAAATEESTKSNKGLLPCASAMALPLAVIGFGWSRRKQKSG